MVFMVPSKYDTFCQCWIIVGPASQTLDQNYVNIVPMSLLCLGFRLCLCEKETNMIRSCHTSLLSGIFEMGPFSFIRTVGKYTTCKTNLARIYQIHCNLGETKFALGFS